MIYTVFRYKRSPEEIEAIKQARKGNKDKRANGSGSEAIAEATGFQGAEITEIVAKYSIHRLETISEKTIAGMGAACRKICQYQYAFGAEAPLTGDRFFVMPYCNTGCTSILLKKFPGTYAAHIILFHIPPYTPEMNPIEHVEREFR